MDRLKQKRTALRSQVTRLISEVDSSLENGSDRKDLNVLSARLSALQLQLNEVDAAIEPLVPDEDVERNYSRTIEYQDRIVTYIAKLSQEADEAQRSRTETGDATVRTHDHGNGSAATSKVKLPKLELQRFSGATIEWRPFWEQFQQAIHDNQSLSNAEKFLYLRSALSGKAQAAVAGIQVTAENYNTVIELLKERFGRTDVLIQEHLTQLLDLPSMRNGNDVGGLRRLYDHLHRNIAALTALGVQTDSYGAMLSSALLRRLPGEFVVGYHKRLSLDQRDEGLKIESLQRFLKLEVESREKAQQVSQLEDRSYTHKSRAQNGKPTASKGSAAFLFSTSHTKHTEPCAFCDARTHLTQECKAPLSLEEKKRRLREAGRCFRCSIKGHTAKECRNKRIKCKACGRRHITPLCDPLWKKAENTATELHSAMSKRGDQTCTVLLQTAQVWAEGQQRRTLTRLLFDGGSQRSFITKELSHELQLEVVGEEDITIHPFGGAGNVIKEKRRRMRIWLRSQYDRTEHPIEALEIPEICSERLLLPEGVIQGVKANIQELGDVTVPPAHLTRNGIDILIGADYYWTLVSGEVRKLEGPLVAVKTEFGWTLQGPIPSSSSAGCCTTVAVLRASVCEAKHSVFTDLRSFWELESMGIIEPKVQQSEEDEEIVREFSSSIKLVDKRYEVALPWKTVNFQLADNEAVARKRLATLTNKLLKDEKMMAEYHETICQYLQQGFAEKIPAEENNKAETRVYYMPHRAVLRPDSLSTKVRVVFDASSSDAECVSLNEVLEAGPNLNPDLLKVLLNFRIHRIGISADIEKAFLQISVRREDRDALRFFWYQQRPTRQDPNPPLEVWRMSRVPFGATSSPFLLAATLRYHLSTIDDHSEIAKTMAESLYIDDLITGTYSEEEAEDFYRKASEVMNRASMTLRKWNSNSKRLQQLFNSERTGCVLSQVECPASCISRVLGLIWDKDGDVLAFSMKTVLDFLDRNSNTKRFILQAASRIYDPLGLISPVTVTAKLMFQTLWELGVGWDAPLPEEVRESWTQWHSELHHLTDITVPRWYGGCLSDEKNTIHIFTDASPKAYGAVAYLCTTGVNETMVTLLLSKSRVAPIKKLSLPRLELMGMVIGARLKDYLTRSLTLRIAKWHIWTDSTIALHWVRGSAQHWKPFVANRVLEIQQLTDPDVWNYCPGTGNPADFLTRGVAPKALKSNTVWWNGPSWLTEPTYWPNREEVVDATTADEEKRTVCVHNITIKEAVIEMQRYSSLSKLVRVVTWAQRFIHNSRNPNQRHRGHLTTEELTQAQTYLVLQTQREAFYEELQCVHHSTRMASNSPLRDLNVYFDKDAVLRVGGRLGNADLSYSAMHPIVLPADHHFTELLITSIHRRLLHAGVLDTLTELREQFWVVRGRQMVKKLLKRCVTCNRFNSRAATEPVAPLPRDRVAQAPSFEVTGVDFAGPLNTKDQRNNKKSYILILTCAVTRAIHLELVTSMSAANFLMAFRRFIARRGVCRVIYSDNAKAFQRASRDLKSLWTTLRGEEVQNYFTGHQIQWKFIVERAAWWGGFWERMVRSVKSSLKKVLGNSYRDFEELTTILTEIEAIINSRPLTYVYTESSEPQPLTPSHFLVGKRLTTLPTEYSAEPASSSQGRLTRRWRHRQRMIDEFWRRWRREYLTSLRSAHFAVPTSSSALKKGTIVLVHEHNLPRQLWKTGEIVDVLEGHDKRIRACMVRLPNGTVIRRPIQLLYPMESTCE